LVSASGGGDKIVGIGGPDERFGVAVIEALPGVAESFDLLAMQDAEAAP
jgi:hypothetical protein